MGVVNIDKLKRHLTVRDIDIMVHLSDFGFATRKEIYLKFWANKEHTNAHHRRIRKLIRLGIIENLKEGNFKSGLKISKKGQIFLKDNYHSKSSPTLLSRNYKTQFEHDLTAQRVIRYLSQNPLVMQIETEKQLIKKVYEKTRYSTASWSRLKLPDAMILIETSTGPKWTAIEIELTRKSSNRYYSIMRNHLTNKSWDITLYFTKGQKLMDIVKNSYNQCRRNDPFVIVQKQVNGLYFVTLDNFFKHKSETLFKNDEDQFSFKSLENKVTKDTANNNAI